MARRVVMVWSVALVSAALVISSGCAGPASPSAVAASSPGTATPSATAVSAACTVRASDMNLKQQAGQLVMVGVSGRLDASEAAVIKKYRIGSVILMGNYTGGVSQVKAVTAAVQRAGKGQVLIATDQEGGLVRRLRGSGFPTLASAATQATWSNATLSAKARKLAEAMAKSGVRLDLAPVADVVPKSNRSKNRPIAKLGRGYGSNPATVSAKVTAFRDGMTAGRVATAVKHFPGLGAVTGNTDFAAKVTDTTTTANSTLLRPFRDAVADDADAVMVSSAYYTRIDAKNPALFSSKVIGLLRGWGFENVVISDDLGVAAAVSNVPAKKRAVRFVAAGGDLAITVNPRLAGSFTSGLVAKGKSSPAFARKMTQATARVLSLKESLGLVTCS